MSNIKINGQLIDVDIEGELKSFDWGRPRWSSNKLIATSPFRFDRTPSFFVTLEGEYAGTWGDSGAYDREWESGNFAKLLSFLRDETYEESVEYLLTTYGVTEDASSLVTIPNINIFEYRRRIILEEKLLLPYTYRHVYLTNRGISEKVQRFMGVGYSNKDKAITIPWHHPSSELANVKFRKVYGKVFWYKREAAPIRSLVYGIDKIYKHNLHRVVICEAEIDALSWWSCGIPAIAVGGSSLSDTQLNAIRKSPAETLILAMDNDKPGRKMRSKLIEGLSGYVRLEEVAIPHEYKDSNEALVAQVDLSALPTNLAGLNFDNLFDRYVKE